MSKNKAYDKAKWHSDTVSDYGLPVSHASHHIVFFFRWLIEHDLISEWLRTEEPEEYEAVRGARLSALEYFENNLDGCLISDGLNEEGNAFAEAYFDYDRGRYIDDLTDTLKGHIAIRISHPFQRRHLWAHSARH